VCPQRLQNYLILIARLDLRWATRKSAHLRDLTPVGATFFQIFLQQPDITGVVFISRIRNV